MKLSIALLKALLLILHFLCGLMISFCRYYCQKSSIPEFLIAFLKEYLRVAKRSVKTRMAQCDPVIFFTQLPEGLLCSSACLIRVQVHAPSIGQVQEPAVKTFRH